ncbi:MAG: hypothetical protein II961_00650 [Candidatus Riflebacteria bacterium]|nr:hypothetical protein [Candidatus Riflebacteria bacterium]
MINNNYKKIKGFSLVEISIVGAILLIFLIPVITLMSRGSSGTIRNRNEILAQQYASNYIAYSNLQKFDSEKLQETTEEKLVDELKLEKNGETFALIDKLEDDLFKRYVSIKDFPATDEIPYNYKVVTVRVEWLQPGEKNKRNVTMSGLVNER